MARKMFSLGTYVPEHLSVIYPG